MIESCDRVCTWGQTTARVTLLHPWVAHPRCLEEVFNNFLLNLLTRTKRTHTRVHQLSNPWRVHGKGKYCSNFFRLFLRSTNSRVTCATRLSIVDSTHVPISRNSQCNAFIWRAKTNGKETGDSFSCKWMIQGLREKRMYEWKVKIRDKSSIQISP